MTEQILIAEQVDKTSLKTRQERRIRWQHGLSTQRAELIAALYYGGVK